MSPEEEIIRAGEARGVLDSAIFNEAKTKILDGIYSQMAKVPLTESEMHTRLIITLQIWNHLESYLKNIQETGRIADFQLQQQKKRLFG